MSEPEAWSMARRIRAIHFITDALDEMPKNGRAAVSASFDWPILTNGVAYSSYVGRLDAPRLAALESAVMAITGLASPQDPVAASISTDQLGHYLNLAEEALADIAVDTDLSGPEAARLLRLVGGLASALRQTPSKGFGPLEMAVTVIVGDLHIHADTWDRNRSKKWYTIVASIVGGLLLAMQAIGGYPGIKELAVDLGFGGPSTQVTATQVEPNRGPSETGGQHGHGPKDVAPGGDEDEAGGVPARP